MALIVRCKLALDHYAAGLRQPFHSHGHPSVTLLFTGRVRGPEPLQPVIQARNLPAAGGVPGAGPRVGSVLA